MKNLIDWIRKCNKWIAKSECKGVLVFFVIVTFILNSCTTDTVYYGVKKLPNAEWHSGNILEFKISVKNTLESNIYMILKNTKKYPYQNLFISYTILDEHGEVVAKALESFDLYDLKTGKSLGDGFLSNQKTHEFVILPKYSFVKPGVYTIRLEQFMRSDVLHGIKTVGLLVEKSNVLK